MHVDEVLPRAAGLVQGNAGDWGDCPWTGHGQVCARSTGDSHNDKNTSNIKTRITIRTITTKEVEKEKEENKKNTVLSLASLTKKTVLSFASLTKRRPSTHKSDYA